jgi:hypothetical protein
MNYLFNPTTQFNFKASLGAVNWWQVGRSAIEGLIPAKKGYVFLKAAGTAIGDVLVNAMYYKDKYTSERAIGDFATGFIGSLAGDGMGKLIDKDKYGIPAIRKGLKKINVPDARIDKLLGKADTGTQPKGTASIAEKIEANAAQQLAKMEGKTTGAHYFSRHGAGTTLDQQYTRATTGLTPDGFAGKPVDASRFLSNQAQLNAVQRAQTIYKQTGQASFSFNMGEVIGEGYTKGGGNLIITTNVQAVFRNGELYTLYPKLSPMK